LRESMCGSGIAITKPSVWRTSSSQGIDHHRLRLLYHPQSLRLYHPRHIPVADGAFTYKQQVTTFHCA
jgi:hypothetical protein